MDSDSMTLKQLEAHLATVDDLDTLRDLRATEKDGQNRDGAFELIDRHEQRLSKGNASYPTYDLGVDRETTFVVGHPDGEIEFKTNANGTYKPTDEREAWAMGELGAKPKKE